MAPFLFPVVSLHGRGEACSVNFGLREWLYDPHDWLVGDGDDGESSCGRRRRPSSIDVEEHETQLAVGDFILFMPDGSTVVLDADDLRSDSEEDGEGSDDDM